MSKLGGGLTVNNGGNPGLSGSLGDADDAKNCFEKEEIADAAGKCQVAGRCACDNNIYTDRNCLWRTNVPASCVPKDTSTKAAKDSVTGPVSSCPGASRMWGHLSNHSEYQYVRSVGPGSGGNISIPGQCAIIVKHTGSNLCQVWTWDADCCRNDASFCSGNANFDGAGCYTAHPGAFVDCGATSFNPDFYISTGVNYYNGATSAAQYNPYVAVNYGKALPTLAGIANLLKPGVEGVCSTAKFSGFSLKLTPNTQIYNSDGIPQIVPNTTNLPNSGAVLSMEATWTCN